MLKAFVDLEKEVTKFTSERANELRDFELSEEEWRIIKELVQVLSVCDDAHVLTFPRTDLCLLPYQSLDFEGCHHVLLGC